MTTRPTLTIGRHQVGSDQRPYIIAEMSGNHNGDLGRARAIVEMAAEAGAHAIKLQTYTADTLTIDSDRPEFTLDAGHPLWGGRTLYDLYTEGATPWEWHEPLFSLAADLGMDAFSSPFDPTAIDFLSDLDVPAFKIASSEIVDIPLVRACAERGKPMIISTGMASVGEVHAAVEASRSVGNDQIVVLSCTAEYPADPRSSNLRGIPVFADTFDTLVGLSDHTMGIGAPLAAVAFGAVLVEKHVTLSRADGGVDSEFSLEPHELKDLVEQSEVAWQALGEPRIGRKESEQTGPRFRRSLFVTADVRAGDTVTPDNVRSIRPASGLPTEFTDVVMGRTFRTDVERGTPLSWDLV